MLDIDRATTGVAVLCMGIPEYLYGIHVNKNIVWVYNMAIEWKRSSTRIPDDISIGLSSLPVTRDTIERRYFDLFVQDRILLLIRQRSWIPQQEFFFCDPKQLNLPYSLECIRYNMLRKGLQLKKEAIKQALTDRLRVLSSLDNNTQYAISLPNCWPELTTSRQTESGDVSQSDVALFSESAKTVWSTITTREVQVLVELVQTWTMGLHVRVGCHSSMRRVSQHTLFERQCLRLVVQFL
jgi:hypothetical protein